MTAIHRAEAHGLPLRGPGARPERQGDDRDDLQLARATAAFRGFMESLGLDLDEPNLAGTDRRVARAYRELFRGLDPQCEPVISTFPNSEDYRGLVTVGGISFYSVCAHHFLPFFGTAHVGYVPGQRLAGLSKLARVVDWFARRPQLQERLTEQVAGYLEEQLAPLGVIVAVEARHLCMEMRGVAKPGVATLTTAVRGTLTDERLRREFLAGVRAGRATSHLADD